MFLILISPSVFDQTVLCSWNHHTVWTKYMQMSISNRLFVFWCNVFYVRVNVVLACHFISILPIPHWTLSILKLVVYRPLKFVTIKKTSTLENCAINFNLCYLLIYWGTGGRGQGVWTSHTWYSWFPPLPNCLWFSPLFLSQNITQCCKKDWIPISPASHPLSPPILQQYNIITFFTPHGPHFMRNFLTQCVSFPKKWRKSTLYDSGQQT